MRTQNNFFCRHPLQTWGSSYGTVSASEHSLGQILNNFRGFIKLCDFGVSRILENSLASTQVGTIAYWAPEILDFKTPKYNSRADIWSFGITLLEAIFGKLPYLTSMDMDFDQLSLLSSILNFDYHEMIESSLKNNYSQDLNDFLSKCVAKIENRFTFFKLLDDVFYQRYKDSTNDQIAEAFIRYQVSFYQKSLSILLFYHYFIR